MMISRIARRHSNSLHAFTNYHPVTPEEVLDTRLKVQEDSETIECSWSWVNAADKE